MTISATPATRRITVSSGHCGSRATEVMVRGLTGADLLTLRAPTRESPAARARVLAGTVASVADTGALPWPDLERILIACHVETFGARPQLIADCPACETRIELKLDLIELLEGPPAARGSVPLPPPDEAWSLDYRAPTAGEMERAASLPAEAATALLARAMTLGVAHRDQGHEPDCCPGTPEAVEAALGEANAAGLHLVGTICPDCGANILCRVDALTLIEAEAARRDVVRELGLLSNTLGLSREHALALPEARRHALVRAIAADASA